MNKELISVIVPVYNCEQFIDRCFQSIFNQEYNFFELIVINDGSTDRSLDVINKYSNLHPNIIVINQDNRGVSYSRNRGIEISSGSYITFVDADDTIEKDHFLNLYNTMKNNKADLSIVGVNYVADTGYSGIVSPSMKENNETISYDRDEGIVEVLKRDSFKGFSVNKLFKGNIIKRNNIKYNTSYIFQEDLDFVIKYIIHCNKITYFSKNTYNYFQRSQSTMHDTSDYDLLCKKHDSLLACVDDIRNTIISNRCNKDAINAAICKTVDEYSSIVRVFSLSEKRLKIVKRLKKYIIKNFPVYLCNNNYSLKRRLGVTLFTIFPKLGFKRFLKLNGARKKKEVFKK